MNDETKKAEPIKPALTAEEWAEVGRNETMWPGRKGNVFPEWYLVTEQKWGLRLGGGDDDGQEFQITLDVWTGTMFAR